MGPVKEEYCCCLRVPPFTLRAPENSGSEPRPCDREDGVLYPASVTGPVGPEFPLPLIGTNKSLFLTFTHTVYRTSAPYFWVR